MQKLLIVAAALIAASCGAATAQNSGGANAGQGGGHNMMAQADTNHDGKISRAEFLAARDARFTQMDANHDGSLQASERPHWGGGAAPSGQTAAGSRSAPPPRCRPRRAAARPAPGSVRSPARSKCR